MEHTLALGKPVPGAAGARYARLDDGPGVVMLAPPVVRALTHGYLDFVSRSLLQLDAARITALGRRMGNQDLELHKRDGSWRLVKPAEQPADGPTLDALVGRLASLRAERVAAYPAGDPRTFGLDSPAAVVTLRLPGADGKTDEHVLRIGKPAGGAPDRPDRFAAVDRSPAVVVLPGALAAELLAGPLHFRDRNLVHLTGVDRVVLERGPRKAVFAKTEGSWKLIEPVEADTEASDLEDFVNAAAHLRADQLVVEQPHDLKPYGLDRPEARWHFQVEGKEVLSLVVGGPEAPGGGSSDPKGSRRYARLGGGPVFLLPAALTAQVLGEYRNRTLWPPLDAAQIERLRYGDPRHPFVLEKADQQWHVAGSPGTKVKADAVQTTLDALAGLRAARYVTDTGGELKLYGLEPPQFVLEIQTPTGSRTLHIGRPEGESRNRYARVPASDHAPVFVIGEADATRIVRPLAAFTQGATRTAAR